MSAPGRKRTLIFPNFCRSERPLWRKAEIREFAAAKCLLSVRISWC